jgi:Tol biopolymer transport system component
MLERCLTKRPRERYHSIADARVDIDAALADPGGATAAPATVAPSAARSMLPWVAAILLAILVGAAAWISKPSPTPAPALVARFAQVLEPEQSFRNMGRDVVAVSADGRQIVYNTSAGLALRVLDEVEPRIIPGTDGAITSPFFSPDGEWVGYYDGGRGELRKIRTSGGASVLIATASNPMGASWAADGTIVFGQPEGIMRVSGDGGPLELVTSANAPEQLWDPQVLPDGAVLFTAWMDTDTGTITVSGSGPAERTELFSGERAVYVPTGHLVVADPQTSPNTLLARTFDAASLEFGGAVPIEERVALFQNKTHFAVSPAGSLVYIFGEGTGGAQRPQRTLTWVDRNGEETPLALPPDDYTTARISPDGTKVALVIGSVLPLSDPPPDIWILDLETNTFRQLTFNADTDDMPVWSRDSDRIYYRSFRDGAPAIYSIPWDGGDGQAMLVGTSEDFGFPSPWSISPDEGVIAFNYGASLDNINLATLSLTGDAVFTALLAEPGMETEPVIAPNGRWLAYQLSFPQSAPEINVRPFPGVAPQRIPVVQGGSPVFSPDGTELFYFDGEGISVFDVGYEPGFFRRNGRSLFRRSYQYGSAAPDGFGGRAWDLHPNAEQFLMINVPGVNGEQGAEASRPRIHIVLNWFEDLAARAQRP